MRLRFTTQRPSLLSRAGDKSRDSAATAHLCPSGGTSYEHIRDHLPQFHQGLPWHSFCLSDSLPDVL